MKREYKITPKSNLLIIARSLEGALKDKNIKHFNIGEEKIAENMHEISEYYQEYNMLCIFTDSAEIEIAKNEIDDIIITDMNLEDFLYDNITEKDEIEFFNWLQEYDSIDRYYKYVKGVVEVNGYIHLEQLEHVIYNIMVADSSDVNVSELDDYASVLVDKNRTYTLTVDYSKYEDKDDYRVLSWVLVGEDNDYTK